MITDREHEHRMDPLAPLESLFAVDRGNDLPLPHELSALYGPLRFPLQEDRPYVIGNFVTTLDGVASLSVPGLAGGGPISGSNPHDRMVMGLLRSVADAGLGFSVIASRNVPAEPVSAPRLAFAAELLGRATPELAAHVRATAAAFARCGATVTEVKLPDSIVMRLQR